MQPGFSVKLKISHFKAVFRNFLGVCGTTYHPRRKSVLNRIFVKNNFLCKNYEKSFGN